VTPPVAEKSCHQPSSSGNGAPNVLRLPPWVLSKIALRQATYTGQLTINFFQGGVTTVEWRQIEKQMK
jgi:hypothetical protein